MTLGALLTFAGIGVGIYALVDPVTRQALRILIDRHYVLGLLSLSILLIIWADYLDRPLNSVADVASFLCLMAIIRRSWIWYQSAELTESDIPAFVKLIESAILEERFSELERLLSKNRALLLQLDPKALRLVFEPKLVTAMLRSGSLAHLQLLSDPAFLDGLDNPMPATHAVVRCLLQMRDSPLRVAVVRRAGGDEFLSPDVDADALFEATFLSPGWYLRTRADYPLVISAVEQLRSGKLNSAYNSKDQHYSARQGYASRSHCPVFLAMKTHVLALEAAISTRAAGDYYVSDLWDIFREILRQTEYDPAMWQDLDERPTPYSWLLAEILQDHERLFEACLSVATTPVTDAPNSPADFLSQPRFTHARLEPPGRLGEDLAVSWSICISELAQSDAAVSDAFIERKVRHYLDFMLRVQSSPYDVGLTFSQVDGLEPWYTLLKESLSERLKWRRDRVRLRVANSIDHLDAGKHWVQDRGSLKKSLGLDD